MRKFLQFLHSIHPLSPELSDHLTQVIQLRQLERKDFLLRSGHISRQLCYIDTGLLRSYYLHSETEVSSWFLQEGDVLFTSESFFTQQASHENIQALEPTSLLTISYTDLQEIYRKFPEFNIVTRKLTEKYYQLSSQQLFGLRSQQAPERYKWLLNNHPALILRVPAKYLASWLGISEVMLSKIKGKGQVMK